MILAEGGHHLPEYLQAPQALDSVLDDRVAIFCNIMVILQESNNSRDLKSCTIGHAGVA